MKYFNEYLIDRKCTVSIHVGRIVVKTQFIKTGFTHMDHIYTHRWLGRHISTYSFLTHN